MSAPRHLTIDSRSVRYFVHGRDSQTSAARTIVLVPSMYLMARTYEQTARAIVSRDPDLRVVSVELPGSGGSSPLRARWTFDDYAFCLVQALESLDVERPAALIGHSNSGAVVLTAAARHPSHVGPIVLADTTGGDVRARMRQMVPGRLLDFIHETPFSIRSAPDAAFNVFHHPWSVMNQFTLAQQDLSSLARRVTVPALLAWGAEDHTTPMRCARELERIIPNAKLYVSKEGSHDWIVDRAEEFAMTLARFMPA